MTRMVIESLVDDEGVLKLAVPVGKDEANRTKFGRVAGLRVENWDSA